ncbi:MAG: hypothetical protein IKS48_13310 [Eubacterium sp.]|nr:hypothetical protein [Eubacterium sp.]
MKNINKLTDWVIQKIEKEYKEDIALLLAVHGHNTDGDQHGLCFDYFVPTTERGCELAETFIINGVGHDLYPRSWERLEESVQLNDMPIVIEGAEILYAHSKEDEERFNDMKMRLQGNLKDPEFVYGKALEYMDKALEIYRTIIFEDKSYRVINEAGCIHLFLTKAVAVLNHTYSEGPIFSRKQAYDSDPDSRIYSCPEMKLVPDGFFENAERLLKEKDPEKIKEIIMHLLKATRTFILEREPGSGQSRDLTKVDFNGLANWYQELSLTWKRLRYFCKNNMTEKAFYDAGYLQEELLYIFQEYHVDEMNLLDSFDADDLSKLVTRADCIEKKILGLLADHETSVNSYDSLEDFLEAREI